MKFVSSLLCVVALICVGAQARAAETVVLCDSMSSELKGESVVAGAVGCVDLSSWSWGDSNPVSESGSGGVGAGKPTLSNLNIEKFVDSSTVMLMADLLRGTRFQGTLQLRVYGTCASPCSTPTPFFTISLGKAEVASQSLGGTTDGGRPTESISLAYDTVQLCYRTPDPNTGMLGSPSCESYSISTGMPSSQ